MYMSVCTVARTVPFSTSVILARACLGIPPGPSQAVYGRERERERERERNIGRKIKLKSEIIVKVQISKEKDERKER